MPDLRLLFFTIKLLAVGGAAPDLSSLRFFGLFSLIIGLISLVRPHLFWHLRIGRKIPGVPPTDLYLLVLRFGAVLLIALGLVMIFSVST